MEELVVIDELLTEFAEAIYKEIEQDINSKNSNFK